MKTTVWRRPIRQVVDKSPIRYTMPSSKGLGGTSTSVSKTRPEVKSPGRIATLLIALHSPNARLETGLRMCPVEKAEIVTPFAAQQSVLCSPVYWGTIAKYGHVSGILRGMVVRILCSQDCVAESKTFEPSVQVRNLQESTGP